MTQFLIKDTLIPPYMAFPRFLLDMEQLSETAKILYVKCYTNVVTVVANKI